MKSKLWLLVGISAAAWAQTQSPVNPAAAKDGFEQTQPPAVSLSTHPVLDLGKEPDPQMSKIQQVQAEMAKAESAPSAAPESAPPVGEFSMLHSSLRMVYMLCAVLGIILVLAYLAKKVGRRSPLFAGSSLAKVLGKVYLEPRVCLHFVQIGGKVLVLGVTTNAIARIAEFDPAAFEAPQQEEPPKDASPDTAQPPADSFLSQFKASLESMRKTDTALSAEDADVAALRKDIQRLQKYLEDSGRGLKE